MNLPKNSPTLLLASVAIVILALSAVFLSYKKSRSPIIATFRPIQVQASPGQKFTLKLYLEGNQVKKVTAADIGVNYDKRALSLTSFSPGLFFEKFLIAKWDTKGGRLALAKNPESKVQTDLPVAELEFLVLKTGSSTAVSLDPNSQVYIGHVGGVILKSSGATFNVK